MNLYLITRNDAVGWDEYDGGETVEQVCWCSRGLKARWISALSASQITRTLQKSALQKRRCSRG